MNIFLCVSDSGADLRQAPVTEPAGIQGNHTPVQPWLDGGMTGAPSLALQPASLGIVATELGRRGVGEKASANRREHETSESAQPALEAPDPVGQDVFSDRVVEAP